MNDDNQQNESKNKLNKKIITILMVSIFVVSGYSIFKVKNLEKELSKKNQLMITKDKETTFEKIVAKAKLASDNSIKLSSNDKYYSILSAVGDDNVVSNTSDDLDGTKTIKEILKYVTNQYEQGQMQENPEFNLYITKYLMDVTEQDIYFNTAYNMIGYMYQLCENNITDPYDYSFQNQVSKTIEAKMNNYKTKYDFIK